jgi:hypothetical protein
MLTRPLLADMQLDAIGYLSHADSATAPSPSRTLKARANSLPRVALAVQMEGVHIDIGDEDIATVSSLVTSAIDSVVAALASAAGAAAAVDPDDVDVALMAGGPVVPVKPSAAVLGKTKYHSNVGLQDFPIAVRVSTCMAIDR